jgi:hypothetical protein
VYGIVESDRETGLDGHARYSQPLGQLLLNNSQQFTPALESSTGIKCDMKTTLPREVFIKMSSHFLLKCLTLSGENCVKINKILICIGSLSYLVMTQGSA